MPPTSSSPTSKVRPWRLSNQPMTRFTWVITSGPMPSPATISSFLLAAISTLMKRKARHSAGHDESESEALGGGALPEPGLGELVLLLEAVDELALLQGEADIVESVEQAVLAEGMDVEPEAAD